METPGRRHVHFWLLQSRRAQSLSSQGDANDLMGIVKVKSVPRGGGGE